MNKTYEWFEEQKRDCFDKMASLQYMLEDNEELFGNVIDTETLECDDIQSECLSYLMSEETLTDLIEFLLHISAGAKQLHKNKYSAYAYLEFNDRIFYVSKTQNRKDCFYQFVLVTQIPKEDANITPFNIVWYGLDSLSSLFLNDKKKCLKNILYKYDIPMVENPQDELNDHYFVTDNQITYHFSEGYDWSGVKKIALAYFFLGRKKVEKPIFSGLETRLKAWENALNLMERDGIKLINKSNDQLFIKNKTIKSFINEDIFTYFKCMKGLFESEPEKKVKITWHNGNAHVERCGVNA